LKLSLFLNALLFTAGDVAEQARKFRDQGWEPLALMVEHNWSALAKLPQGDLAILKRIAFCHVTEPLTDKVQIKALAHADQEDVEAEQERERQFIAKRRRT